MADDSEQDGHGGERRAVDPWATAGARPDDPAAWAGAPASPYRSTAFDVLGLPVGILSRSDQLGRVRRRLRRARAGLVRVDGRIVDEAAVHAAEAQLAQRDTRLAQSLLVHTPPPDPDSTEVDDLRERLAAVPVEPAPEPGTLTLDRAVLLALSDANDQEDSGEKGHAP